MCAGSAVSLVNDGAASGGNPSGRAGVGGPDAACRAACSGACRSMSAGPEAFPALALIVRDLAAAGNRAARP